MPKIVFDLLCTQPIGNVKFHGGGEYTKTVFQYVINHNKKKNEFFVFYNYDKYMDNWIYDSIKKYNIQAFDVKNIEDINNGIKQIAKDEDVRFFTGLGYNYQESNIEFPPNVIAIGVFHGLRILEKPYDREAWRYGSIKRRIHEFLDWVIFRKRNLKKEYIREKNALNNFNVAVTSSVHSAYSIKLNYGDSFQKKKIEVFYAPMKHVVLEEKNATITAITEKYIMMVSADRWLKNSCRGIKALDQLYSAGFLKGVKTRVYGNAPQNIINRIRGKDNFDFFGYVTSEELESAYENCELFFYPTLNEGFGYPPLEAMKYGKTCAISAVCSLTEVYGDSVYYFNPYDIMEMKNRILQALECKITEDKIENKVNQIKEKQLQGLKDLNGLILGLTDTQERNGEA